jgi:hypothetical protein
MSVIVRGYGGSGSVISRGYGGWVSRLVIVLVAVCKFSRARIRRAFGYECM